MNSLKDMVPTPNERGIIIGCTGCGKTTLATKMLRHYGRVIAIDPKGTLGSGGDRGGRHLVGYDLARTPRDLERMARRSDFVQYRPDMKFQTPEWWERVYNWIYRRGRTMVYNDELADVHHYSRPPISLRRIITSGRELGIGHLGATQRPRNVERRLFSEAERWYVFHVRDLDDRRLLASRMGPKDIRLPPFGFWYSHDKEPFQDPVIRRLRL